MLKNPSARVALLAGLLLAQVALVAFLYWPRATSVAVGPLLPELAPDAVERLTLHADGASLTLARDEAGGWVLPDADSFPVIEANVTQLISDIVSIDTSRLVADNAANHARLRVDAANPIRQVDLALAGGVTETVFLGTSPNARATHVRRAGSDAVYLARDLSSSDVHVDAGGWIDSAWLSLDPATVTGLAITNAAGSLALARDDAGGWTLQDAAPGEAVLTTTVESWVTTLAALPMLRPLGQTPRAEWALDAPAATIVLETAPLTATAGSAAETVTLTIGARDAADDSLAVQASSSPWIAAVTGATLDPLLQATRASLLAVAEEPAVAAPTITAPAFGPVSAPITNAAPITP